MLGGASGEVIRGEELNNKEHAEVASVVSRHYHIVVAVQSAKAPRLLFMCSEEVQHISWITQLFLSNRIQR